MYNVLDTHPSRLVPTTHVQVLDIPPSIVHELDKLPSKRKEMMMMISQYSLLNPGYRYVNNNTQSWHNVHIKHTFCNMLLDRWITSACLSGDNIEYKGYTNKGPVASLYPLTLLFITTLDSLSISSSLES